MHLLEDLFFTDAQKQLIADLYSSAALNGGPFPRLYGLDPNEYTTTMNELFDGDGGPEGIAWLKNDASSFYGVLSDVTGRTP